MLTLGFIYGLSQGQSLALIACVALVLVYEAINGFHDTANAVATVIYTKTLKPTFAVIWSGIWNFLGVFAGGIGVAMGMMKLMPLNNLLQTPLAENIAFAVAVLIAAISWNLFTWWRGIPCSSSHTMIGALLGGAFVFSQLHDGAEVNWAKAQDIGLSLLMSPFFGFSMAIILMLILRSIVKKKKAIFNEPDPKNPPPAWIRGILVLTCTLVSFFHGSNDGQKGVGLMLVVLIAFLPMQFALDPNLPLDKIQSSVTKIELSVRAERPDSLLDVESKVILEKTGKATKAIAAATAGYSRETAIAARKNLQSLVKEAEKATEIGYFEGKDEAKKAVGAEVKALKKGWEFAPTWILAAIAFALGLGTMVGWKRIVVTIGEKIGKSHLTYAQGASAEIVAAMTIGLSTYFKLPVSTTHVLSSGIAGSMVASGGIKNLQKGTLKSIITAWLLTLPVTFALAGGLFLLFRMFI